MRRQDWFLLLVLCLVVLCEAAGSQEQAAGSQPQSPTVTLRPRASTSQPGMPQVRVTVDQRRVPLGTSVTFTLAPASIASDRRYVVTLYFGDGRARVMRQPQEVYVYRSVGNYTYAVDVERVQSCRPRVKLSTSPSSVVQGETVKFAAELSENCPNIQYQFHFGDRTPIVSQSGPSTQHTYTGAASYWAYVDITDGKNRIGGSQRIRIDVKRPSDPLASLSVSLTAEPSRARLGQPVTFTARASRSQPGDLYRFIFGDGETLSQTNPQANHTYKSRRAYRASVEVSQFINNQSLRAVSSPAVVMVRNAPTPAPSPVPPPTPAPSPTSSPTAGDSPTPGGTPTPDGSPTPNGSPSPNASASGPDEANVTGSPTPSPTSDSPILPNDTSPGNKWWYLLVAAAILFIIYQASAYLFVAQPTFAPFADHGVAAVAHEKGALPINFELVLDPNVSGGDYSVTTDQPRLVTNSPDAEERQRFEI